MALEVEKHYKVKEVCSLLSIDRSTLYRWVKNGKVGEPVKDGKRCTRFPASVIEKYQASLKSHGE